jgi:hypothetical protein
VEDVREVHGRPSIPKRFRDMVHFARLKRLSSNTRCCGYEALLVWADLYQVLHALLQVCQRVRLGASPMCVELLADLGCV